MSADSVDDLQYAEDMLTAEQREGYCRPTCGYADALDAWSRLTAAERDECGWEEPDEVCSDDCCGCPCGHPGSILERVG
jgi:hypothetical protein